MNIVVCIKQVPGTSKVQVDEKTGVLIRSGIATKMNPYDLYALESAVRIKESLGARVHVLTMGPPQAAEVLREAFMMGADEGTLLTDRRFAGADCLATAYSLAQAIQKIGLPDLIVCGKQTTDGDTAQVGPEMAEFLGLPHVTNVCKIRSVTEQSLVVESDLPYGIAVLEILTPCLITVEKDIYPARLPSYRLKRATRERKIQTLGLNDLEDREETHYGLKGSPTQVVRIFPPESNAASEIWEGQGADLAARLFHTLMDQKMIGH